MLQWLINNFHERSPFLTDEHMTTILGTSHWDSSLSLVHFTLSLSVICGQVGALSSAETLSVHSGQWAFCLQGGSLSALALCQPLRAQSTRSLRCCSQTLRQAVLVYWLSPLRDDLIKGKKLFISRQWENWARDTQGFNHIHTVNYTSRQCTQTTGQGFFPS